MRRAAVAALLAAAAAVALLLAPIASGEPDGLKRVAIDEGFSGSATDHALADLPTADYAVEGVDDPRWSTALAGLVGIAATFAVGAALFAALRRLGPSGAPSAAYSAPAP